MTNRDLVRAAAYQQVREDLRGSQGRKTNKKVNCTPPNVQCGGRCIPPTWDCRLKGQGTNSELKVHAQDISAGIASVQRGGVDLVKGAGTLNPARFERGRRSLIRGAVKIAPGDNLEQKKALRRRLDKQTNGIAGAVSLTLAVGGGYAFGRRFLPAKFRNGIETPAKNAVNAMLDRAPFFAGRRANMRSAAETAAGGLGVAAIRDRRQSEVAKAAANNVGGIGPLGFRTRSMDTFESNLVGQMDAVAKKKGSFETWKSEAAQTLFGAQKGPPNARHSVYSERAANEFIKSQYGLTDVRAKEAVTRGIGNAADPFTQASRNKGIEGALGDRINSMGADFRQDMRVRGIVSRDTYIKQVGMPAVERKLGKTLTGSNRKLALDQARATMISAIDGTGATQARKIRTEAVTQYDSYFRDVALKTQRFAGNPINRESPMGDVNLALARFEISRKSGMQPNIQSREHGDLLLRQHWHKSVQKQKSSLTISDGTAQRVAKTLTRSTTTPTPERAFSILQANKIDAVRATAPPKRSTSLGKTQSFSQLAKSIRERAGNEGMSMQASYEAAKREMKKRGDRMDDEHMAPTITKRNPPSPLVTNSSAPVIGGGEGREHLPQSDDEMVTPLVPVSSMAEAPSPKEAEQQERPKPSGTVKIELKLEIPASAVKTDAMPPRVAAYLQTREDLRGKSSGTGKPCGASHISKAKNCTISSTELAKNSPDKWGGESAAYGEPGYRKFLKSKGVDPAKLGGNSPLAEKLALEYDGKPVPAKKSKEAETNPETGKSKGGLTGKQIAAAAVIGTVGAVAVAAANDAYQLNTGLGMPETPSVHTAVKPFAKGGIKERGDLANAMGAYYDKVSKDEGWEVGNLVYARTKNEPNSHFAVYMGKKEDGTHSFSQMGVEGLTGKTGGIQTSMAGPGAGKNLSGVIFAKAPSHAQPAIKYSPNEISRRISKLAGKTLDYDVFDANCESWANMIVSGKSRSTQANRLSAVGKTAIRGTYKALENVATLDPEFQKQTRSGARIKTMAQWLDRTNPRGNDMGYQATVKSNSKLRKDAEKEEEFLGLVDPSTVIKENMSDIEAVSATKRWLMVLTAALSDGPS